MSGDTARSLLRGYLALLLFIAASYILGASYLGTNGHMTWRQADVYSHILGFQGKQGLKPFDSFFGILSPYDFPVYSFAVARLASYLGSDPLVVVRNVNFLAFLAIALTGYHLLRTQSGRAAGVIFLSLLCTSRLMLHYFSVPLPDVLALALAFCGFALLLRSPGAGRVALAVGGLVLAALIKSPVAFPFVVCLILVALAGKERQPDLPSRFRLHVAIASLLSLLAAVAAEGWRAHLTGLDAGLVNGAHWYFGRMELRFSPDFWIVFGERLNSWGPPVVPFGLMLCAGLLGIARFDAARRIFLLALLVSFFLPWLVFANLYFIHDYYQLPVAILLALFLSLTGATLYRYLCGIGPVGQGVVVVATVLFIATQAFLLIVSPFSERTRPSLWSTAEYLIPEGEVVLVAGDGTHNTPIAGGRLGRRIKTVTTGQLESGCADYLRQYRAIVAGPGSACLQSRQAHAEAYFSTADGSLLVQKSP